MQEVCDQRRTRSYQDKRKERGEMAVLVKTIKKKFSINLVVPFCTSKHDSKAPAGN